MFRKISNLSSNFRTWAKNVIFGINNANNIEILQNKYFFFEIFNFEIKKMSICSAFCNLKLNF